jgi:hypothetical protein
MSLVIYNAAKTYYANGGKWNKGEYSRGGKYCFIGAASRQMDMTVRWVEGHLRGDVCGVDLIKLNDSAGSVDEAMALIADALHIPEDSR